MKKPCNNPEPLCRCIDWKDEDFDVEIDHLIRNFEFLRFDLEYVALEPGKTVWFCEIGRCRVCGGRMCVGSTWPAAESTDELMAMIYRRTNWHLQNSNRPLPAGVNSYQEMFPLLFHEADREFARAWLSRLEKQDIPQANQGDGKEVQ